MEPIDQPLIVKKQSPFEAFMSGPMTRNKMIILGSIVFVALVITGLSFWLGFRSLSTDETEITPTPTVETSPSPTPIETPAEEPTPSDTPTPTTKSSPTPTKTPTQTPTATLTPTPSSTPTPTPTALSASVTYVGHSADCPKVHTFNGMITSNAAGTVKYRWVHMTGPDDIGPTKTLVFSNAGTQSADVETWTLNSTSYEGWAKIEITEPSIASSNQANFSHTCP